MGQVGSKLRPRWAMMAPRWPSWAQFGPSLGPGGPVWTRWPGPGQRSTRNPIGNDDFSYKSISYLLAVRSGPQIHIKPCHIFSRCGPGPGGLDLPPWPSGPGSGPKKHIYHMMRSNKFMLETDFYIKDKTDNTITSKKHARRLTVI
mgnify:CR=1 FL=1